MEAMIFYIIGGLIFTVISLALVLYATNPKTIAVEVSDDFNIRMYKKARLENNKIVVGKKGGKIWLINKETKHFNLRSIWGNSTVYFVTPEGSQPLRFNNSCFSKDFINPKTIKSFYENTMIDKILTTVSGLGLNEKVILILALGLVGVTVAYFIFVAPNYIPLDACPGQVITATTGA